MRYTEDDIVTTDRYIDDKVHHRGHVGDIKFDVKGYLDGYWFADVTWEVDGVTHKYTSTGYRDVEAILQACERVLNEPKRKQAKLAKFHQILKSCGGNISMATDFFETHELEELAEIAKEQS